MSLLEPHLPIILDQSEIELRKLLHDRGKKFARRLLTSRNILFRSAIPIACTGIISSLESDKFLYQYSKILCKEITNQLRSINPYHAIFLLCRLPWLSDWRNKSTGSKLNRHRLTLQLLISELNNRKNISKYIFTPKVDEFALLPFLILEYLSAELHYVQSVYRSIQKARFFGEKAEIEIHNDKFRSKVSPDVSMAIKTYEYKKERYFSLFEIEQHLPQEISTHFGIQTRPIPRQDVYQIPLCIDENKALFTIDSSGNPSRMGKYICVPIDTTTHLKNILSNCSIANFSIEYIEALGSLLCSYALQQQLLSIRCEWISKRMYRYDLETKGYIKIENPKSSNNLLTRLKALIKDLAISQTFQNPEFVLKKWLEINLDNSIHLPTSLDFEPHNKIGVELDADWIICFPDSLNDLLILGYSKLRNGDQAGTFFGFSFEDWAISYLDKHVNQSDKWETWVTQQKLYITGSKQVFKEVDYAIKNGETLFLIDMKHTRETPSLHKVDAHNNWKKLKKELLGSTDKKAEAIWENRKSISFEPNSDGESKFPSEITCIIPITCTSWPMFCKTSNEYILWTNQERPPFLRVCVVKELIEVLDIFNIEQHKQLNLFTIPPK